jgi:acyl-CoA thioester hydrolase
VDAPFAHQSLRVRYAECDPQGIVFNANYLIYFDVVFTELWRDALGPWQERESGVDVVVAEANAQFRAPARFDDELDLKAQVARIGDTSLTTDFEVARDGALLVSGWLRHVCVSNDTWRKITIPDSIRNGLTPFLAGEPAQQLSGSA